jgi:putative transposase
MIESQDKFLSISRQCELLDLSRSGWYYVPRGLSLETIALMHLIDEEYTRAPIYGVKRMTAYLHRQGYCVGHQRVRRLMRLMSLVAIYPKPRLSRNGSEHRIFPYLLKELTIDRPNQVWSADITYIRLVRGFVYLIAVMDWFSRYVLSWELSTSMDVDFCLEALNRALAIAQPEIFNTDQGVQFTSRDFTGRLEASAVRISMDGRGRAFDNIFIERLWRTVKYEDIYLRDYREVPEARSGIDRYFRFYNRERLHQSLGYRTPAEVYFGAEGAKDILPVEVRLESK